MIKVKSVIIEELENPGCNNGNYPMVSVHTTNGDYHGLTCNCRKGCAIPGMFLTSKVKSFQMKKNFLNILNIS